MSAEVARPRGTTFDTGFIAAIRKLRSVDIFVPTIHKNTETTREMEVAKTLTEGEEFIMTYGLKTTLYRLADIVPHYVNLILPEGKLLVNDSRIAMDVTGDIFEQMISDKKVEYVYEETGEQDKLARPGDNPVWFTTEDKLRVNSKMGTGNSFYDNIIFPSFIAQQTVQVEALGGNETSPGEIAELNRMAGFCALDISRDSPALVRKIKLLSPTEARKFKGGIPKFNIRKDMIHASVPY